MSVDVKFYGEKAEQPMSGCNQETLNAYLDDELPAPDRAQFEAHLQSCPECAHELARLQSSLRLLSGYQFEDLTDDELANLHAAINANADVPIWRITGALAAIAASILIVSCAWLAELPDGRARTQRVMARPEPWEQVATTLRAEPLPSFFHDDSIQFANAELVNFMLQGLSGE